MKTSYYLLLAAVLITLTGMVATDMLLQRAYDKVDWTDNYQFFARRTLPAAKHLVIDGMSERAILIEPGKQSQALINPADSLFFRANVKGDTLFIVFDSDTVRHESSPVNSGIDYPTGLVLRLPDVQNLALTDARVTLAYTTLPALRVTLQHSALFMPSLTIPGELQLIERKKSLAVLTRGSYKRVDVRVEDESRIHVNDTRIDAFAPTLSDRAEVQFSGQANRWVKRNP